MKLLTVGYIAKTQNCISLHLLSNPQILSHQTILSSQSVIFPIFPALNKATLYIHKYPTSFKFLPGTHLSKLQLRHWKIAKDKSVQLNTYTPPLVILKDSTISDFNFALFLGSTKAQRNEQKILTSLFHKFLNKSTRLTLWSASTQWLPKM